MPSNSVVVIPQPLRFGVGSLKSRCSTNQTSKSDEPCLAVAKIGAEL